MHKPVFITGRFRSGSTLLWNLFRNIPECKAFYEPCNDLLLNHIVCNTPPQSSHVGVSSYWDEYIPIVDDLRNLHKIGFGFKNLYLEAGDHFEEFEGYIRFLLGRCDTLQPVLQFNRVDFRLPWLRGKFPDAAIIHLYRNPRDQWYSMVQSLPQERWLDPGVNTDYDLLVWSCSLAPVFPFLFGEHVKTSYHRHYLIWKLSKMAGMNNSDLSIDFDNELIASPVRTIKEMLRVSGTHADVERLSPLVVKPETGKWRAIRDEGWFDEAEAECDGLLGKLSLIEHFSREPISSIRKKSQRSWRKYFKGASRAAIDGSLSLFCESRSSSMQFWHNSEKSVHGFQAIIASYQERLGYIATACDLTQPLKK
jgi:hypothetical protein